jgi:hypothetical protein
MTWAEYIMGLTSSKGKKLSWGPVSLFFKIRIFYNGSTYSIVLSLGVLRPLQEVN